MTELLSGILTAGYALAGLHFLKFRQKTGDRLFLIFAIAFWVLAIQRVSLVLLSDVEEAIVYLYMLRVVAFVLIIGAIVDKNRAGNA